MKNQLTRKPTVPGYFTANWSVKGLFLYSYFLFYVQSMPLVRTSMAKYLVLAMFWGSSIKRYIGSRAKTMFERLVELKIFVGFEIAALFSSPCRRVKKRGNFKTNKFYQVHRVVYSFVSNKRRVANKRRVWKKYQNLINVGSGGVWN